MDRSGSQLKIDRASFHLNALATEIKAFEKEGPYRFRPDVSPAERKIDIRARAEQPIPDQWSLVVGEFCHNARGALDLLVNRISTIDLCDPARRRLQFPIFDFEEDYRAKEEQYLRGVSSEHRAIIESFQPFRVDANYKADPLGKLSELNNADKHRLILIVEIFAKVERLRITGRMGGVELEGNAVAILEPGSSIGSGDYKIRALQEGMSVSDGMSVAEIAIPNDVCGQSATNIGIEWAAAVIFGDSCERVQGQAVVPTLQAIEGRVREVLPRF